MPADDELAVARAASDGEGRLRRGGRRRFAVACLIGLSGPLVGILAWRGEQLYALGLHGAAAIIAWAYWRRPDDENDLLALQAATLTAAFPVIGPPIALLIFGRETTPSDELRRAYATYIAFEHTAPRWSRPMGDARAALLREVSVRPLGDQLRHGDLASKQAAAYALRRMEGDEGVVVLRQALRHSADDTRLLASLALVKLEEELGETLGKARKLAEARPDDAHTQRQRLEAARRYAESGLPTGKACDPLWREVEAAAERARTLDPAGAGEDDLAIAKARLALGDLPAALVAADRAWKGAADPVVAGLLRCELLYKLGHTEPLRAAARELGQVAPPGSDAAEISAFWAPQAIGAVA